jgi:hypothetical protein
MEPDINKHTTSNKILDKIKLWLTGIGSYYILTWIYDYIVISALLLYFGIFKGMIVVLFLSMTIDLATLKFYDWLKKDWLALETLKDFETQKSFLGKVLNFVHNKSTAATVVVLSFMSNAFVVTTYMRKGAGLYNGMTRRDWIIFISSSLIINLYWVFIIGGGIEIVTYLYKLIFTY